MPKLSTVVAPVSYAISLAAAAMAPATTAAVLALTWPFDRNRAAAGRSLRLIAAFISRTYPYWRIRVEGRWPEAAGPFVVVANHQSLLDIPLLCNVPREMKWIAKESLFKIPWIGWAFRLSGDIPVRRGEAASGGEALAKARAYLDRGMNVMLFPEGTRSTTGELLPFKTGAFKLAVEAGRAVLPIAVNGTAEAWPKGSPWVRPARLSVRVLDPVPLRGDGPVEVERLRREVRERIASAVAELRAADAATGA
jgi:1-acyl-sn-glycerol-3-phosphate acyltransferase